MAQPHPDSTSGSRLRRGPNHPLEGAEPTVEEQRLGTLLALLGFQLIHDTGPPEPIMQESLT
jgi:hypothetical protein